MNYEKKYNEALEDMRIIYPNLKGAAKLAVEHAFPELRESEDERIRKELIEYLRGDLDDITTDDTDRWITWLEKQKELMPPVNVDPCDASWDAYYQRGLNKGYELGLEAGRKEQKPVEWSEEDEKIKERLITRLNWITYNTRTNGTSPNITFFDEIVWLKSIRPCPSWKPSEEQMNELHDVLIPGNEFDCDILATLYADLKKLMEDEK